jgi:hypothetical protein
MKKTILTLAFLFVMGTLSFGQVNDSFMSNCLANTGDNTKYLKDFRVQLGKAIVPGELRYRANMSLWKNTRYRFTMCNEENSGGQLIITIKDDSHKLVLSSFDKKTGKLYSHIDFECRKSGIYQINYDFINGQQGSGVGFVSMIK